MNWEVIFSQTTYDQFVYNWKDTKVVQLLYSIRKTLVLIIDFRIGIMLYINYILRKEAYTNGQIMESEIA